MNHQGRVCSTKASSERVRADFLKSDPKFFVMAGVVFAVVFDSLVDFYLVGFV